MTVEPNEEKSLEGTSVRSKLPAGVVDAGMASAATFVAGLVAANLLDRHDLGIYAVFFAAFLVGQLVAYQLIYVPAEIAAVSRSGSERLTVVRDSLRLGFVPTLVGASVVFMAAASTAPLASSELLTQLTITAFAATLLSPTQDHVRRTLHIGDRSWRAAAMSVTQLVVTAAAIGVMILIDVPVGWVPFGALTVANLVSLSIGLTLILAGHGKTQGEEGLSFRELTVDGRWLLLQAAIPAGAAFVTANIITYLAGAEAMGHAEAARIVAQPIVVLAAGLIYPLRPRAMGAALVGDLAASLRVERLYVAFVVGGGLAYIPFAGISWPLNPMQYLVPAAYEVQGLVIATIMANIVLAGAFLFVNEMMAAGRARSLASVNAIAAVFRMIASTSAGVIGAFARPAAEGTGEAIVFGGVLMMHRDHYRSASEAPADA